MLAALTVRDIVLIEAANLEFAPGLNVLTGETGAGKSILLDALGLAAGGRGGGRAGVRPGANQGSATAIFEPPAKHPSRALLKEQEIASDGELVLRRTIAADGRTRAFINDEAVGVGLMRDLGAALLEVHGQADDRGLFDNATHRATLDSYGGLEGQVAKVAEAFAAYDAARAKLEELKKASAVAAADAEFTAHAVKELTALGADEGEEEKLVAERALLANASRIADEISAAHDSLTGEKGAEASLAAALRRLSRLQEDARKAASAAETAMDQAFALVEEARRELDSLLSRLEVKPGQLEKTDDRIHDLRAMARKYGGTTAGLPKLLQEFQAKLSLAQGDDGQLRKAERSMAEARETFLGLARQLSAARKDAAKKLEKVVETELAPLKLGHAKFRVTLTPFADGEASASGLERVAFEVATVEGAAYGPLARIASGGELARFSLALKVALASAQPPAALVFDEVDRGVGGAVADAVGERLQRLAEGTQVLLVTHSPQVAARAARHFRISRLGDKTKVVLLTDDERLEEIARMLSGAAVTAEARAAAKRLLDEANQPKKAQKKRA